MALRVTKWLKERATIEAQSHGLTLSEYMRTLLKGAVYDPGAVQNPLAELAGLHRTYSPWGERKEQTAHLHMIRDAAQRLVVAADADLQAIAAQKDL
jgi:hypothetical protein